MSAANQPQTKLGSIQTNLQDNVLPPYPSVACIQGFCPTDKMLIQSGPPITYCHGIRDTQIYKWTMDPGVPEPARGPLSRGIDPRPGVKQCNATYTGYWEPGPEVGYERNWVAETRLFRALQSRGKCPVIAPQQVPFAEQTYVPREVWNESTKAALISRPICP